MNAKEQKITESLWGEIANKIVEHCIASASVLPVVSTCANSSDTV